MDLAELRERLEKASGGDREIDAALFDATPDDQWPRCAYREENCYTLRNYGRDPRYHDGWLTRLRSTIDDKYPEDLPRLTSSLDAIVSLIERKLPRPSVELRWGSCNAAGEMLKPRARLFVCIGEQEFGWTWKHVADGEAATPALALCLAFVKAMEAQSNEPASESRE